MEVDCARLRLSSEAGELKSVARLCLGFPVCDGVFLPRKMLSWGLPRGVKLK